MTATPRKTDPTPAALQDAVAALTRLGCKPTRSGDEFVAFCPIHEADGQGHKPSLNLKAGDTQAVVVRCHAGCDWKEILKALDITPAPSHNGQRRIVATYSYRDLDGREAFQKIRYEPKDFRQRWPDGHGGWLWKRPGNAPHFLYRLPELKAAISEGRTVFICEGEKDTDRVASLGLAATSNVEGASKPTQRAKWKAEYTEQLTGAARVILLPHNDEQGRAHMRHVAEQLAGKVADIRSLELSGLPDKGDVSDWLNAGHTVEELERLANEAPEPASVAAVPDSESGAFTRHDPRLMRKSGSSELLKNLSNAITICENLIPGLIGYNEFRQRIEARLSTKWRKAAGDWTEYDTAELADAIARRGFPSFNMELLSNAVMTVAHRNSFNPAQDRLRSLAAQWDGVERLAAWLVDYLNAGRSDANADYLREIGAAWLKGVVARVLFPGCKRDDVLVLRGPQGWCKSTAANCIAECIHPDSFTDNLGDLSSKDSRAGIRGMVIAELAELAALNKSDIESVKAFVAGRNDHFREAYGRGERDYPRTVSFIGTTNDPTFLKDPSGNRRWWPVTITAPIDIPRLEAALPQLLGEAASRVLSGEAWHVKDERALAQANDVRAAHYADDAWTDVVLDSSKSLLRDKPPQSQYVTIAELMGVMGLRIEQQTVPVQMRIGGILRVNQFESKRKRLDGRLAWVWVPGIPPLDGGYTRGIQQTPSETADVLPYPPVSPTLEHFVENDRSGGREDTADPPNLGIYRNEADMGDAGGTPSETAGSSCIPPSVSPTKGGNSKPVDTPPCTDILADTAIAPPAETTSATTTCKAKTPDIARADPRRSAPPVCLPSTGYPFRYVTKCDKPTPIMPESGYGDPVGCSHCGQRWGARP
jgi:predicted P-loop ATPase